MSELKCPSCKKQYLDNNPPRLLTMCGHTYCQNCLKSMIKRKDYRFHIRCPLDKLKMGLDSATPLQFPRNMVLIEAMSKPRSKSELNDQSNQFLPNNSETTIQQYCKSSSGFRTSAFLDKKRNSNEEGICLLHQKPLDIICLQERIMICAECALFGMHKGHSFTTVRDLQVKRNDWVSDISSILEKKKDIDQKTSEKQLINYIERQVKANKKDKLNKINDYFGKIREIVNKHELKVKQKMQQQLDLISVDFTQRIGQKSQSKQRFKLWQNYILQTLIQLQSVDLIKSIDIFGDFLMNKEDHFINKGNSILKQLEQQNDTIKQDLSKAFKQRKLIFLQKVEEVVQKLVKIDFSTQKHQEEDNIPLNKSLIKPFCPDYSQTATNFQFPEMQEVSLLDLRQDEQNFKNLIEQTQIDLQTSIIISNISFNSQTTQNSQKSTLTQSNFIQSNLTSSNLTSSNKSNKSATSISPKMNFKKKQDKIKQLNVNKSLINLSQNKVRVQSPRFNKNNFDPSARKGSLNVPASTQNKDKLKRSIFKVKDPQRLSKLLKILQNDSAQTIDFTGLQLGNQIAKQIIQKLKQSKKIKNVRLMKNLLNDDLTPSLLSLTNIQIINLAQNSFTIKTLDLLLQHYRSNSDEQRPKNIQLGHNSINVRKCRQKIQELKQFGVTISL